MILTILMAGNMFAGVFIAGGGVQTTEQFIAAANLGPWLTLGLFLFICFLAGFILDWISILLIFIPVFMPIINKMGFDPVWFCVLFLIIIQTSYLSPPMAPAIFYLRGIAPPEITIHHMFRGVVPFIVLQLLTLVFTIAFPQLVLWLPSVLLGIQVGPRSVRHRTRGRERATALARHCRRRTAITMREAAAPRADRCPG